jgi:hypothetical protein
MVGRALEGRPTAWRRSHPAATRGALTCPAVGGLAVQQLPFRLRRGRAGLRCGRAARQRQRRRHPAGHHLAVAAQAFTRHGLGMPARNPQAIRERAAATARQRAGWPAPPALDSVFMALNPGALPARERSPAELFQWVRREEQYASLGAMWWSSHTAKATPASPPPAPWRSSGGPTVGIGWPASAPAGPTAATPTEPTAPADPSNPRSERWWLMPADLPGPTSRIAPRGFVLVVCLAIPCSWPKAPLGSEAAMCCQA